MEVQPILEVLVGKTIEQALVEVLEEEELAALREQQRRFLEIRAAEIVEAQRLEERERRWQAEKARRMHDYEEGMQIQTEMEERIAGAVLTQGYMADLLPSVLEGLEEDGFLTDTIKQGTSTSVFNPNKTVSSSLTDLDSGFMPWLMKEVAQELQEMVSSRDVLTGTNRIVIAFEIEISWNYYIFRHRSRNFGDARRNLQRALRGETGRKSGRRSNSGPGHRSRGTPQASGGHCGTGQKR